MEAGRMAARREALPTVCLAALWLCLVASAPDLASDDASPLGDLVPIPVRDGVAEFDLPTGDPRDQFLVLVSSLAYENGPFPVEVRAEPVNDPEPLRAAPDEPDAAWQRIVRERSRQLAAARATARRTAEPVSKTNDPPAEKTFWVMVRGDDFIDAKNYEPVRARLARVGRHCAVYFDAQTPLDKEKSLLVDEALNTFDRAVYPTAVEKLGRHRDVDSNGRFVILFTPWLGRLGGGTTSVGGFVRGADFFEELEPPLGNRCDMMYLNAGLNPGPHLRTLIAHEYTHAITMSEHVFGRHLPDAPGEEEENWLDEAIAHLAENLHGYSWSNLDYRVSAFLNTPESCRLVVDDYYAAELWRGHGNRGSTYLFLRWCVDQYGDELLRDLVQSNLCGVENIETATGQPFAELYRTWSAALFLSQSGMSSRRDQEFRHVSLRGPLGTRSLAGPRHELLDLSGDSRSLRVVGTSTKYLIAHSSQGKGTRVRVTAPPESVLQVSVRRLPSSLPRLELKATRVAAAASAEGPCFHVQLSEHNGAAVTLTDLAWERVLKGSNREIYRGAGHKSYSAVELAELFGATRLPACGSLDCSRLSLGPGSSSDEVYVLRISGRDDAGRAVSGWCTIDLRPAVLAERPETKR
jgi:hypothetical protein